MIAALIASAGFNQAVEMTAKKTLLNKTRTMLNNPALKHSNVNVNRTTNIARWVSYWDAYSGSYSVNNQINSMVNGSFTADSNIMQYYDFSGANYDTAAIYSSYSLVHLDGYHYTSTWFNPQLEPFDPATDITIDSVDVVFNYEWVDTNTIDTLVVRFATPNANQLNDIYNYLPPYDIDATGDTLRWLSARYDVTAKEMVNTVAELKLPLTKAYLKDQGNWINFQSGLDSTTLYAGFDANEIISGHAGLLLSEVTYISGRTLVSGVDTIGVNANKFSPTWRNFDGQNNTPPPYEPNEYTCGGALYGFGYFEAANNFFVPHWSQNSAQDIADNGGTNPFETPYIDVKILQTNTMTAGIEELNNGAELFQNYPNPTSDMTTIKYALENASTVSFEVMDVTGKVITSSYEGNKTEGLHTIELNTNSLNAGVYFYSVIVNGNRLTKKMTISK